MNRFFLTILVLLGCGMPERAIAADPASELFFKPNDRVVFLGDSITEQYQYSTYIELYLTTRMPTSNIAFLNAGIGGDTANGGSQRFQTHVLDEKPTAVTINFGMNDGGYGAFNANSNKNFIEKTSKMLDMAKKAGVRVALISPNAVDPRRKGNGVQYLETQKQFYAPLKDLASKYSIPYADQYTITRAATDKMGIDDPMAKVAVPYGDGFHTSPPGGLLMAHAILTSLHAPALVSAVTIDATAKAADVKNAKVTDLAVDGGKITFTRTDNALPLPMQKDWLPMLPYVSELKDLNWYGLTVKGLKDGNYTINIDGIKAMTATAKDLAEGVNLGNLTTGPVFDQANKVLTAINAKNNLVKLRFFGTVRFMAPDWLADVAAERKPSQLKKQMDKIDEAESEVYKLAVPKPRKFEINPVE